MVGLPAGAGAEPPARVALRQPPPPSVRAPADDVPGEEPIDFSVPPPPVAVARYGRHTVELAPELGLARARCTSGERSSATCDGVSGGLAVGFIGLWRMAPRWAWGGQLQLQGHAYDPPASIGWQQATLVTATVGLVGRHYFMAQDKLDPYVQLGLGVGAFAFGGTTADGQEVERSGSGLALELSGGLDFLVSRSVRLGPALSVSHVFVDKLRTCVGGNDACEDAPRGDQGYISGVMTLSVRLTFGVGSEH